MHGKIMNRYKSYDLMDNEKYQRIEYLLQVMHETFGYDLDAIKEASDLEAANDNKHNSSHSSSTDRGDVKDKNHDATIEMAVNPKNRQQPTQSDFGIFSREGKSTNLK